ncbi:MAG: ABC transporter substrate-binding protein, partial [Gaiellaceae bacterium]
MRRWQAVLGVTAALVIAAATVAGTSLGSRHVAKGPTKLTIRVGWSARELSVVTKVVKESDQAHPDITVSVVGGINDNKIVAAIRAGNAPDVVSSFNSYNVGNYCGS